LACLEGCLDPHSPDHANRCGAPVEARPVGPYVRTVEHARGHECLKESRRRPSRCNRESTVEFVTPEAEIDGLGLGLDPGVGLGGLGRVLVGQLAPGGLGKVHGLRPEEGGSEDEDDGGLAKHNFAVRA
jgi:hypothetical protein